MGKQINYEKIMKIWSLFLVGFAIFVYVIVFFSIKVNASNNVTIAGVDMGYSDGSYFSKNGSACGCHGRGTCGVAADCNCIVVSGASQCYGWSMWIENKLYGYNEKTTPKNFTTVISNYSNCTGSGLYNKLNGKIGAGAHIRTSSSKKGYAHSISVISYDHNGINITDCNHSGKCQVDVRKYSWDSFASFVNGYGGISFVKTCKNGISVPSGTEPFGYLDSVTAEVGKITVRGWAADMDAPNSPIEVHFYTVKNEKREWLGSVLAGESRPDICKYYPNLNEYHGFQATFDTSLDGEIQVEAYGINVGNSGNNIMLTDSPKTVSVPKDSIAPSISDIYIKDLSASGYTVHCIVRDDRALGYVKFPTWTDNTDSSGNPQDDITWESAGDISGTSWELNYRVNISDHNNEVNCWYNTHIYCHDASGNLTSLALEKVLVENTLPTISDVKITDISEKGYTVSCVVNDDYSGINRVQFPTWYENNNPYAIDGSWITSAFCSGKLENGRFVYRVNTSDYGNRFGKYTTHIYAWDECGNQSDCYGTETLVKEHKHEYISTIKKSATCTEAGIMLYTCKENDDSYEEEIPATGHQNTELRNAKESTCTQEGYTGDSYCKDCGAKITTGQKIDKIEHNWDSGKVTKEPTSKETGTKTYTCTICKTTKVEEIPVTEKDQNLVTEGWKKNSKGWWYQNSDGSYPKNQWKKVGENWYHFDANGYMQTGWLQLGSNRYYLKSTGVMAKDEWVDNGKSYVDADGKYVPGKTKYTEGWKKNTKGWWYQNSDGSYPKNQWKKIGENWYHFDASGYMQTGWLQIGSSWYYLKSTGGMAKDEWVDNGKSYVDANGKYVPGKAKYTEGWKKNTKGWWYQNGDGSYPRNQWKKVGENWYHFDANGYMQTGWLKIGTIWYYLKSNGAMASNEWILNGQYFMDANGHLT